MYYYFYKITNLINSKYYYGVHQTNNLNDGYMGSGVNINRAYKKYGVENFRKDILKFFDNKEDMFEYERQTVTEEVCSDPMCYNICVGGYGGKLAGFTEQDHEEWRQKICNAMRRPEVREKHLKCFSDPEYLRKQHFAQLGKKRNEETLKKMKKPKSETHKQHMREANIGEKNPMYGKHIKWINNGIIQKTVLIENLQQYLDSGWVIGMLKKSRQ